MQIWYRRLYAFHIRYSIINRGQTDVGKQNIVTFIGRRHGVLSKAKKIPKHRVRNPENVPSTADKKKKKTAHTLRND